MTLAQAAKYAIELGGIYDGHEAPDDVHKLTKASVAALAGQGLVAAAKDNYPRDGMTFSYVASFAEVEVDVETGKYYIVDFLASGDVGTVIHPRALGGQCSAVRRWASAMRSVRSGCSIRTTAKWFPSDSTTANRPRFWMSPSTCNGWRWIFQIRRRRWARAVSASHRFQAGVRRF
jgi:hypothetical protein